MELTTTLLVILYSVLMPTKSWYAPTEPLLVELQHDATVQIVLMDAAGQRIDSEGPNTIEAGKTVDLRVMFPAMRVGTYIAYAVPEGRTPREFIGTPLVIQFRGDSRPGAPPGAQVIKVEPLALAEIETDFGTMTAAFFYDSAPNTVANFISLSTGRFYDGLTFHRIIPGFVVQGGDPQGTGAGGPGYNIEAEFNNRQHVRGVLSMAREGDPLEPNLPPRPEYANSAGSQFFICLNYDKTRHLDRKYTAFAQVIDGLDVLDKLAGVELADVAAGRPAEPPVIRAVRILPVTAQNDPYPSMISQFATVQQDQAAPTTAPAP